jgi:hypothetical protein
MLIPAAFLLFEMLGIFFHFSPVMLSGYLPSAEYHRKMKGRFCADAMGWVMPHCSRITIHYQHIRYYFHHEIKKKLHIPLPLSFNQSFLKLRETLESRENPKLSNLNNLVKTFSL